MIVSSGKADPKKAMERAARRLAKKEAALRDLRRQRMAKHLEITYGRTNP